MHIAPVSRARPPQSRDNSNSSCCNAAQTEHGTAYQQPYKGSTRTPFSVAMATTAVTGLCHRVPSASTTSSISAA